MRLSDLPFFIGEAVKGLRLHRSANVISVLCIALALISLSFLLGTWSNLEHILEVARGEAEIVVYLNERVDRPQAENLKTDILALSGADRASIISPEETLDRMEALLGPDLDILDLLEGYNPFTLSLEVGVTPEAAPEVARVARRLPGVDLVRDNEEILAPLARIITVVRWLGLAALIAVVLTILVLVSHLIRLGMVARREEIETLRLLGASETFVAFPFVLEGLILGLGGAAISIFLIGVIGTWGYDLLRSILPFMPWVRWEALFSPIALILGVLGLVSGFLGAAVALRAGRTSA